MTTAILISTAISLALSGVSLLLQPSRNEKVQQGKLDSFTEPRGSFGDVISDVWGLGRVSGILIFGTFPPEEVVSTETQGGKGPQPSTTTETYTYFGNFAFLLCTQSTEITEIRFNSKLVYKDGTTDSIITAGGGSIRIYNGTDNQGVDSLLQASLGDRALAYRHRTYIVCENIPLEEFGNAYPQCSATVKNGNPKLSDVIEDICLQSSDLSLEDIDVSELNDIDVRGFQTNSEGSVSEKLQALQKCYFFDVIDTGGVLRFQTQFRPNASVFLPVQLLGAHEENSDRPRPWRETRPDLTQLPSRVEVKFLDIDRNLEPNTIQSVVFPASDHTRVETIDFSGALSVNEAKTIANRTLWRIWTSARTQEFTLPPRFANLEAGDVVEIDIEGQPQQVQIESISYGANHLLQVKSKAYNAAIYGWEETNSAPVDPDDPNQPDPIDPISPRDPILRPVSNTTLRVLDIPLAYPTDTPGVYVFGDGDANWRNAFLYYSIDLGVTYQPVGTIVTRSIFGTCTTTFNGTTVTVQLPFHASLASISPALFEAGRNRSLIGDEIVDFQNAALTGTAGSDRLFELTAPFTRGISGTPQTHGAGEEFYLLSGYKLNIPAQRSDIGKTFYFKAITPGQTLDDVDPVIIVFEGNAFSVVIDDFSPRQGAIGVTVTISGMGFTGATAVSFNEIAAQSFTVVSDIAITAVVATGTTTGKIRVTAPLGVGESAIDFTIVQPSTLTVQEEGTAVSSRQTLNFIGSAVTAVDNPTQNRTDITVVIPENIQSADNDLITRHFDTLSTKPYFLDVAAPFNYRIDGISLLATNGTANATVQINGAPVNGLSNLSFSTNLITVVATSNNFVSQNSQVRLNVTSSSATDVGLTLSITKFVTGNNENPIANILKNDLIWGFEFRTGNNVRKDVKTNSNLLSQNGTPSLVSDGILDSLALSGMSGSNNLFYAIGNDERGDFRRTHTIAYLYKTPNSFTNFTADFVLTKDEYMARREANQVILRLLNPDRLVLYYEYMRSGQTLNFNNSLMVNTWYLFISKYNANNLTITGKLNNVLTSTETFDVSPPSPFNIPFYIGARRNESLVFDSFIFQGSLQYIYRWNRLTTDEEDSYIWNNGNFRFLY